MQPTEAAVPADRHAWGFRQHVAHVAYPLLLGMLAAGCSAPQVDAARDQPAPTRPPASPPAPTPGTPEYLRFTDTGCFVRGYDRTGQTFDYEGKLCGCYARRLYCRDPSEPRCFLEGEWYELRAKPPWWHEGLPMRCGCGGGPTSPPQWICQENSRCPQVELLRAARFDIGSTALSDDDGPQLVSLAARELKRDLDKRAMLEAHAHPSEEPRGTWLAQRRAEAVRTALVGLGADPRRIEVINLGTKPVPGPPDLPACADTSALNPGPFVVISLGRPDEPAFAEYIQHVREIQNPRTKEKP